MELLNLEAVVFLKQLNETVFTEHGDVMMMGAYGGYFVLMLLGATVPGLVGAFIAAMVLCGLLAIVIERFAYRPLRKKGSSRITALITAIGVSYIINGILNYIEPNQMSFTEYINADVSFYISVSTAVVLVLFTGLSHFYYRAVIVFSKNTSMLFDYFYLNAVCVRPMRAQCALLRVYSTAKDNEKIDNFPKYS